MDNFELEFRQETLDGLLDNLSRLEDLTQKIKEKAWSFEEFKEYFRLVHNMKGNAMAADFSHLGHLLHAFESRLLELKQLTNVDPSSLNSFLSDSVHILHKAFDHFNADLNFSGDFEIERRQIEETIIHHKSTLVFLIVDDEMDFTATLAEGLRQDFNCETLEVHNGAQALRACLEQKFDLILTDFNMPAMNGLELLSHLRTEGSLNFDTPLIFMSGYKPDLVPEERLWKNVFIVDKPFKTEKINFLIKCSLNQK